MTSDDMETCTPRKEPGERAHEAFHADFDWGSEWSDLPDVTQSRWARVEAEVADARPDESLERLRGKLDAHSDYARALSSIIWCISHGRPLRDELRERAPHSFKLAAEYIERRDALQAENARLTEERDAAIKVQEMAAMSGGFHARSAENAERQRDAAEARVSELEAENARLLKAMTEA